MAGNPHLANFTHKPHFVIKYLCLLLFCLCAQPSSAQDAPFVVALGVAQDGGYPHMGCRRPCCQRVRKDKRLERHVVSLALVSPREKKWWLFESTPDMVAQIEYFRELTGGAYNFLPEGIFITHAHIGHYTGLMHLGKEVMSTHDVPVYTLPKLKKYLETNGPWSQLVRLHNILPIELMEEGAMPGVDAALPLGSGIAVSAFSVPHRDEYSETAGFRIVAGDKKFIFIPDIDKWGKWDKNIVDMVKSVDVALVDATFYDENDLPARNLLNVPHPLVVETMKLFENETKETKAKVWLIHFNHTNPLLWSKDKQKEVKQAGFNFATQGEKW